MYEVICLLSGVEALLTENMFVSLISQNFDLEKKEDNSEADEDGLKAESPELA